MGQASCHTATGRRSLSKGEPASMQDGGSDGGGVGGTGGGRDGGRDRRRVALQSANARSARASRPACRTVGLRGVGWPWV